ncbi:SPRY-domain-containing protein [Punctularia strigosozonata HHB-11173 SS5]|uniref:SPRY-domain-containing protein n=1 Tax=Punctularia strigosozonata (strain HHB-11173) TaxID=741275 RepID=UPI000441734C|nr:SPRY-domain-containing protein [Punctularia strigosozonata HHB-11173 SS5]EIN13456.1 SPRY-domain-containing protein [Punctularia strigosozonata HHB-11173 SS5]
MSRPSGTSGSVELAPDFFSAGLHLPSARTSYGYAQPMSSFQPRIVRGSNLTSSSHAASDAMSRIRRASGASVNPPRTAPRRTSSASLAHTSSGTTTSPYSLVPASSGAASTPSVFPPPAYLSHSALRHLLQTELTPALPAGRYGTLSASSGPTASAVSSARLSLSPSPQPPSSRLRRVHQQPFARFARRTATPSTDSDDDSVYIAPRAAGVEGGEVVEKAVAPVLRLPTRWSDTDRHASLSISADGRELGFHGPSSSGERDAAAARTNHPIPAACGVYYFEVEIVSKGAKGHISIGFSAAEVRLSRLPGWEQRSWGYHGDDGYSFAAEKSGTKYGPTFGTGDVIGCGIDFSTQRAFYTKNGAFLGAVFDGVGRDPTVELYPSVGLRHAGEAVRANFGHAPFRFDVDDHVAQAREAAWSTIGRTLVVPQIEAGEGESVKEEGLETKVWASEDRGAASRRRWVVRAAGRPESVVNLANPGLGASAEERAAEKEALKAPMDALVLGYLEHHGFVGAARAFRAQLSSSRDSAGALEIKQEDADAVMSDADADGPSAPPDDPEIALRTQIVSAVSRGEIDTALGLLEARCPGALEKQRGLVRLKLRCRRFVELMLAVAERLRAVKRAQAEADVGPAEADGAGPAGGKMDGFGAMEVDEPSPAPLLSSTVRIDGRGNSAHGSATPSAVAGVDGARGGLEEAKRAYAAALGDALAYGRTLRMDHRDDAREEVQALLKRTFGVVAYEDPLASGVDRAVAETAGPEGRAALAAEVNKAVLESQGRPAIPALEQVYRQAGACVVQLGLLGVGMAAFADMPRELLDA